jgi:DNA-binding HxlR family transcriptional regulator
VSKICKDGFDREYVKEQREVYGIAYTQNALSGRWKYLILWFLKPTERRYSEIKAFYGIFHKVHLQNNFEN